MPYSHQALYESLNPHFPLVCRYDTCLDGVLENGETGYAYTTKEEFLAEIERLAADENYRAELAERSEIKSREYDKAIFAKRVEAVYEHALAQKTEEKIKAGKA